MKTFFARIKATILKHLSDYEKAVESLTPEQKVKWLSINNNNF